jgi:hypothetical protein
VSEQIQLSEYLRRNLLVCKAVGAHANAKAALKRLKAQKRPPKWLVGYLEGIISRTEPLSAALAHHRNNAEDNPYRARSAEHPSSPQSVK